MGGGDALDFDFGFNPSIKRKQIFELATCRFNAFARFVAEVAEILRQYPSAPIYHYHSYERTRVAKLFDG